MTHIKNIFAHEGWHFYKVATDGAAVVTLAAWLLQVAPDAATIFTALWMMFRVIEQLHKFYLWAKKQIFGDGK